MKEARIRNVVVGGGMPKVLVPIVGRTREEILAKGEEIKDLSFDVVEWRADFYEDVLTLLSATEEMARCHAERPLVTMSMSPAGVISRICGEAFGSAMTFGAVGETSAPGQIPVDRLNTVLKIMHDAG